MSSGSRRGPSEENILAMLERDAARRRLAGNPRFALYAVSSVVVLGLMGALAWLLHENNSANDTLRLSEQPGVSVTVVPDKPAGQAPMLAMASDATLHTAAAATIIDNPEPPAQKSEEARPVRTFATAEGPRMAPPPAKVEEARPASVPAKVEEPRRAHAAAKAKEARTPATAANSEVPPLVLLSPAQAAAARGTAAKREADAKKGAAKESPAHGQAAARPAEKGSASTKTASTAAASKSGNTKRDEAKRSAQRERADAAHASRTATASKQSPRTKQAATVASTAPAKSAGARNTAQAHARKNAATEAPVDTDVALISAIIMHSDSRAHRTEDGCASSDKKCSAKAGAQQP
jgi:hypothetical protein